MFDQVYNHHVNASFDNMLVELMKVVIRPDKFLSYKWHLSLTDELVESKIRGEIFSIRQKNILDLMAKFFTTRTLLKRVCTTLVDAIDVDKRKYELQEMHQVNDKDRILSTFSLKDFTKLGRDQQRGKNSVLKIADDISIVPPKPINLASQVFRSNLWRTDSVKLVVFEGLKESAMSRGLENKLGLLEIKDLRRTSQKSGTVKKLKTG